MAVKCELIRDHFQNSKSYALPRCDLLVADIPFNIGANFNASRPSWWQGGRVENGESDKAGKAAFKTDYSFSIPDFFAFASRLLKPEPAKGEKGAPCMIVFCSFQQIPEVIMEAAAHGFKHYQHLTLIKKSSASVLKANQRISPATEHAIVLYRGKLPKFNNTGEDGKRHMILDWMEFQRDGKEIPRIHPAQKPVNLLKRLISIFTDPGDTVIDVCAGSGSTLRAARELGRHSYGFEIDREFYAKARKEMLGLTATPAATVPASDTASTPTASPAPVPPAFMLTYGE